MTVRQTLILETKLEASGEGQIKQIAQQQAALAGQDLAAQKQILAVEQKILDVQQKQTNEAAKQSRIGQQAAAAAKSIPPKPPGLDAGPKGLMAGGLMGGAPKGLMAGGLMAGRAGSGIDTDAKAKAERARQDEIERAAKERELSAQRKAQRAQEWELARNAKSGDRAEQIKSAGSSFIEDDDLERVKGYKRDIELLAIEISTYQKIRNDIASGPDTFGEQGAQVEAYNQKIEQSWKWIEQLNDVIIELNVAEKKRLNDVSAGLDRVAQDAKRAAQAQDDMWDSGPPADMWDDVPSDAFEEMAQDFKEAEVHAEALAEAVGEVVQAKQKLSPIEQERERIAQKLAQLADGEISTGREQLALAQKREKLAQEIAELGDQDIADAQRALALEKEREGVERKLAALNDNQVRFGREQVEALEEQRRLEKQLADLKAGGDQNKDIANLKEKIELLQQEENLKSEIALLERQGGDLRKLQDTKEAAAAINEMADEQARLNRVLNDPAALKQARQQRVLQEQLERSTRTWRDKVVLVADVLEKTDSSLQVWFTIGMVFEKAFEVFTAGTIANGIEQATQKLGKFNAEVEISKGVGDLMTGTQARQASLRGAEMGLSGAAQGQLGGFAATLGQRSVALGDSTSVTEATVESLKALQQELAKGELGSSFQDLGVSVSQYDRAVRQAAAQKGVLPEALDLQTRQQILLAQATNDSTAALAIYGNEGLRASGKLQTAFSELKENLGQLATGDTGAFDFGETARAKSEVDKRAQELNEAFTDWRQKAGGVFGTGTVKAAEEDVKGKQAALYQAIEDEKLAESAVLMKGINAEMKLKTETLLLAGEEGQKQLLNLNEIFAIEEKLRDPAKMKNEMAYKLILQQEELLASSKLISAEAFKEIKARLTDKDLQSINNEQKAIQLTLAIKTAEAEAKAAKHRLENTKILTLQQRLEEGKTIATKEFQVALFKELELQGKTHQEAEQIFSSDKMQAMLRIEQEKAVNDEYLKQTRSLTGARKEQLELKNTVADVKLEALQLTQTTEDYNRVVGRNVAVKLYEDMNTEAKKLIEVLAGGEENVWGMVKAAGDFASTLNGISGGALFSDKFLEWVFGNKKVADDKTGAGTKGKGTGGGKKEDDDLLEQLRRQRIERQIKDAARLDAQMKENAQSEVQHIAYLKGVLAYEMQLKGIIGKGTLIGYNMPDNPLLKQIEEAENRLTHYNISLSHQENFTKQNLTNVGKVWAELYGNEGSIDQQLMESAAVIEWNYLDNLKRAGDSAEKIEAVNAALYDQIELAQTEAHDRQKQKLAESVEAWAEWAAQVKGSMLDAGGVILAQWEKGVAAWNEAEERAKAANAEVGMRAGLSSLTSFHGSGVAFAGGENRDATAGEEAKMREIMLLDREREAAVSQAGLSATQRYAIEADYEARIFELRQQYRDLEEEENARIRAESIASSEAALQETQELMAKFSDEARSTAEAGQATFQGGLSENGKKFAESLDVQMASVLGLMGVMDEAEKSKAAYDKADSNGAAVIAKGVASAASAAMKGADSVIKSERLKAGIKGAIHVAESIGSYATGDILGGTMHALAAAKFFVIAATASTAPAAAGGAEKREVAKRTALSANTQAISRDRGPSVVTQVFVMMQPLTGRAIVHEMNSDVRGMRGQGIDARWTRATATVRRDL